MHAQLGRLRPAAASALTPSTLAVSRAMIAAAGSQDMETGSCAIQIHDQVGAAGHLELVVPLATMESGKT